MVGGGKPLLNIAKAAIDLQAGRRTSHHDLALFSSWGEVQEYAEQDSAAADLKAIVELVDTYGPQQIIRTVQRMSDEAQARVVVSTVHKAKGREWNRVRIGAGFTPPEDDSPRNVHPAAARLIYVAVTRARTTGRRRSRTHRRRGFGAANGLTNHETANDRAATPCSTADAPRSRERRTVRLRLRGSSGRR